MFISDSREDVGCNADHWFVSVADAEREAKEVYGIQQQNWITVEDPWPHCQHDFLRPVRIVGRNIGTPQWGKFEEYRNGIWVRLILPSRR